MFNIYIDMNKSDVVLLLLEKWINKYKKSIDCSHPKGFSQKAHCKARKLRKAGVKTKSKPVKESIHPSKEKTIKDAIPNLNDDNLQLSIGNYPEINFGYVQVDYITNGDNVFSSNPEDLNKLGYKMPSSKELLKLPLGKYKLSDAKKQLSKLSESHIDNERQRIQADIDKLEKEYDRLDSTGQNTTQITKQLKILRDKLPVSVEKGKELFAKMRQSLLESGEYTVSADKERLLFDFYTLSFIKTLNINPLSKDSKASFLGDSEEVTSLIHDAENKLLPALKKDLLAAVFYAICCEIRHAVLDDVFDKYNDEILKQNTKKLPLLAKYYKGNPENDVETREESYNLVKKIGGTQNPEQFVKDCSVGFIEGFGHVDHYGGKPWKRICEGWLRLYRASNPSDIYVAIDHIYDLQHNNDTVFDKVQDYYKDGSIYWIKPALNFKAKIKNIREILPYCSSDMRKIAQKALKIANVPQITQSTKNKPLDPNKFTFDTLFEYLQKEIDKVKSTFAAKNTKITIERNEIENDNGDEYSVIDIVLKNPFLNNERDLHDYFSIMYTVTVYVDGSIKLEFPYHQQKYDYERWRYANLYSWNDVGSTKKLKVKAAEIIPTIVAHSKQNGYL